MTLTVVDGDFPREVVASQNLMFADYRMPARRNTPEYYDAKTKQPAGKREGVLKLGAIDPSAKKSGFRLGAISLGAIITTAIAIFGLTVVRRRREARLN
jgi:hypothetical protein